MAEKIYVLIDHANNRPRNSSLEALAMGQKMASETGMEIHGLILGADLSSVTEQLSRYELASIIVVENPSLREYNPDMYVHALAEILASDRPNLFLLAHTYQAIDLAPRLAARLRTALITDCIGYKTGDGSISFVRQMFRSKLNADVTVKSIHPWLVSIQAGASSVDALRPGTAPIATRAVDFAGVDHDHGACEPIDDLVVQLLTLAAGEEFRVLHRYLPEVLHRAAAHSCNDERAEDRTFARLVHPADRVSPSSPRHMPKATISRSRPAAPSVRAGAGDSA